MKQQPMFSSSDGTFNLNLGGKEMLSRQMIVASILAVALIAFEIFNFDTTQFALESLLGGEKFLGIMWASILAIAFCSIDFAGLVRIFTPQLGRDEPKIVWYLMGAWLLGATMNAVMTWWAVSLTLLNHDFGNEVLSREQLLKYVPIFVAGLVLLTRILFIGAFTVAGEQVVQNASTGKPARRRSETASLPRQQEPVTRPVQAPARASRRPATAPVAAAPRAAAPAVPAMPTSAPAAHASNSNEISYHPLEEEMEPTMSTPVRSPSTRTQGNGASRIRNRPPLPNVHTTQVHTHTPGRH
jgi:hypothetical protein